MLLKHLFKVAFSTFLILLLPFAQATDGDNRVHDPSTIMYSKGVYHLFGTGKQIQHLVSTDLMSWSKAPRIFEKGTWPDWINTNVPAFEGHFWAPDVIYMNQHYYLYYSCSTFGSSQSAIGVVRTSSLENPLWEDLGVVVSSVGDTINAIDAGLCRDIESGDVYMTYGSFFGGIGVLQLDTITGKASSDIVKVYGGNHEAIEASTMYKRNGNFFLVINRGVCCKGVKSTYSIHVGKSTSPFGPFEEWRPLLSSTERHIGPGHFGLLEVDGKSYVSYHFYDGENNGTPTLEISPLEFSADGWPTVIQNVE